jgi:hypothetical protein
MNTMLCATLRDSAKAGIAAVLPRTVCVRFPLTSAVWYVVVETGEEDFSVMSETGERFEIQYATEDDFANALSRFGGMVEYFVVD